MRFRSKKMQAKYRQRRTLVEQMLDEKPICERCGMNRSTDIHERLSRARGGSILDKDNCVALCRMCHHFITINPNRAEAEGWSIHSWEKP